MSELEIKVSDCIPSRLLDLAGVAQWIEHKPENQRVAGSIPSQDT